MKTVLIFLVVTVRLISYWRMLDCKMLVTCNMWT